MAWIVVHRGKDDGNVHISSSIHALASERLICQTRPAFSGDEFRA